MNTNVAPNTKKPLLTKAGAIILAISLLLSVVCFVTGFIQIDKANEPSEYPGGNKNPSYGNNDNYTTLSLNLDNSKYLSYYSGETLKLEFSSYSYYSVYLYTYDVEILSITDNYGNSVDFYQTYNDRTDYDYCYYISTYSYTTYTITVEAGYSSPSVYLSTSY